VPQFLPIHFVGKTQNKISLPFSNSLFFWFLFLFILYFIFYLPFLP
jgi:hypothetical protein